MSFNRLADGNVAFASDVDQLIDALQGISGKGQPISLTSLSDAINYAISVKNIEASASRAAIFYGADGNPLLTIDRNGVQASAYGANSLAPVVTTTQTQTLSNKTLGTGCTVPTAALAANAATQDGFAQIATGSTTSATAVDTGLSVTLTTTGGDILLIATLVSANSATNDVLLNFARDGSNIGNVARATSPGAGVVKTTVAILRDAGPSAASHTYKLQYATTGGTETVNTTVNSNLLVLELKR